MIFINKYSNKSAIQLQLNERQKYMRMYSYVEMFWFYKLFNRELSVLNCIKLASAPFEHNRKVLTHRKQTSRL